MDRNSLIKILFAQGGLALCLGCTHSSSPNSSSNPSSANSSTSAPAAPKQLLVANSVMTNGPAIYSSPADGGLVGNLYIQPRASMLAPDTQVVGCGQYGSGALGLDSYLSQPTWITQSLIFTELYVPAENFLVGFPAPAGHGATLPVDSFFAIDTFGNFHLKNGDTAGYYEFALIADDSARLKLGDGNGNYTMIVDNEKPAGPNNGCLEQTQAAHMSCTVHWTQQTANQVRTFYLKPGDKLPIELSYWQGPGAGIAMMAFYRKVADPENLQTLLDPACGQELQFYSSGPDLQNILSTWTPIGLQNLTPLAQ